MQHATKQSLLWNDIDRKFYKGLYEALKDERYLQLYYRALEAAITRRGTLCKHYKKGG